mmetsp:Transcript_117885/g.328379  ORF Transcript_117885/g.328379 Transcript_117885/m.328379 type:complete len:253 (-) Transcript_117885:24-782(-)
MLALLRLHLPMGLVARKAQLLPVVAIHEKLKFTNAEGRSHLLRRQLPDSIERDQHLDRVAVVILPRVRCDGLVLCDVRAKGGLLGVEPFGGRRGRSLDGCPGGRRVRHGHILWLRGRHPQAPLSIMRVVIGELSALLLTGCQGVCTLGPSWEGPQEEVIVLPQVHCYGRPVRKGAGVLVPEAARSVLHSGLLGETCCVLFEECQLQGPKGSLLWTAYLNGQRERGPPIKIEVRIHLARHCRPAARSAAPSVK